MRNWHQFIICLDEAHNYLNQQNNNNVFGNDSIYIGVIEGVPEYVVIGNVTDNLIDIEHYKSPHPAFADFLSSESQLHRKVFHRFKKIGTGVDTYSESITKSTIESADFHTVSVTGIIAARNIKNITGIVEKTRVINASSINAALFLARINDFSFRNVSSLFISAKTRNNFPMRVLEKTKYNATIPQYISVENVFSTKSVVAINYSAHPAKGSFNTAIGTNSDSVDFLQQELFAYGRDGRGVLYVFSAGNGNEDGQGFELNDDNRVNTKSVKSLIVGASSVDLNISDLDTYLNNKSSIPEIKAVYSNYGNRLDLCAPSSPDGRPGPGDLGIYAPTMINGGDVGSDDQIIEKTILGFGSNYSILELDDIKGIFKGQIIELGFHNSFKHEHIVIVKPFSEPVNGITKHFIKLKNDVNFTKSEILNSSTNIKGEITVLKIPVTSRISNNKFTLAHRRGIGQVPKKPEDFQWVYIYSLSDNTMLNGISTQIRTIEGLEVEIVNGVLPQGEDLVLIPDQIMTKVKSTSNSDVVGENSEINNYFECLDGFTLDGFFVGQQIYFISTADTPGVKGNISSIKGNSFTMSHVFLPKDKTYQIQSLGYGNYTSSFGGTSAATPIVTGLAALLSSINPILNAAEIKHILKASADRIGEAVYSPQTNISEYNFGYSINKDFGAGRVNALKAVKMALDWNNELKPRLEIYDEVNNQNVPDNTIVNSPDIILNSSPNSNVIDLNFGSEQKIYLRVHNSGNRDSFIESDVRLLMLFVPSDPSENYNFPFERDLSNPPKFCWAQSEVVNALDPFRSVFLGVKQIGVISPGNHREIEFILNNKDLDTIYFRNKYSVDHKVFLLAHISPFDGEFTYDQNTPSINLSLKNIRHNKHLTCKEIVVKKVEIKKGTSALPGNNYDINAATALAQESFSLDITNVLQTEFESMTIKATKINGLQEQVINFSKSGNGWVATDPDNPSNPNLTEWIEFEQPQITDSYVSNYKNAVFPHKVAVDEQGNKYNVKLEIVNLNT